jgi:diguanylate cyclase (GGDEF)-like protein
VRFPSEPVAVARRWLGSIRQVDLSDARQMAVLRAWTTTVAFLLAAVITVALELTGQPHYPYDSRPLFAVLAVLLVVAGVAIGLLGHRIGDRTFAALNYAGLPIGVLAVPGQGGPGSITRSAMALLIGTVLAAVFLPRLRMVVISVVIAVTVIVVNALIQPVRPGTAADIAISVLAMVLISGCTKILRDLAVSGITQARQREITDSLTGLANRGGLERLGSECWRSSAVRGRPVTAVMVDVDHFKHVNDSQGHAAGDDVLRRLAALLSATIREDDLCVRLGGEEFVVLCPAVPEDARVIAERIRLAVERELVPITVSVGLHEVVPGPEDELPESLWTALAVADQALYEAKRRGRNRVVIAGTGPASGVD